MKLIREQEPIKRRTLENEGYKRKWADWRGRILEVDSYYRKGI